MNKELSILDDEFKRLAKCIQEQERLAIIIEDCMINISRILNVLKPKVKELNEG